MRYLPHLLFTALAVAALPTAAQQNGQQSGQQIAASGGGGGVAACASCHGAHGEGNAASGFPRIAGLSQGYIAHQLDAFAHGGRNNPVMGPIAKAMSAQQIKDVSAYYAGLNPAAGGSKPEKMPPAADEKRAKTLATVGDSSREIQACANCHGPGGRGEPPAYPYLAGQNSAYLKAALQAWKGGARTTDPSGQMPQIAKRLSDNDINALAQYYAAQPAPPPLASEQGGTRASGGSGTGGTGSSSTGQQTSEPTQGIGSEQGAATAGGSQGPGGGGAASGSGPSGSQTGAGR